MNNNYSRCSALRSLPRKKFDEIANNQILNCETCKTKFPQRCEICDVLIKSWDLYYWSNIPAKYWNLEMENFQGPTQLLEVYKKICSDLKKSYSDGISYCFAGKHGLGKTMTACNVLKRAVEKGYSALYTTLSEIVEISVNASGTDRFDSRKELLMIDFLVIDEFDPRFMPTDNSASLFGRILEGVFRTRSQNCLPTFMSSNSPKVIDSFPKDSPIKASIESLMNNVIEIPLIGADFRKKEREKLKEVNG